MRGGKFDCFGSDERTGSRTEGRALMTELRLLNAQIHRDSNTIGPCGEGGAIAGGVYPQSCRPFVSITKLQSFRIVTITHCCCLAPLSFWIPYSSRALLMHTTAHIAHICSEHAGCNSLHMTWSGLSADRVDTTKSFYQPSHRKTAELQIGSQQEFHLCG